jgi:CRISPR-associated protein (TIGR03986 family)
MIPKHTSPTTEYRKATAPYNFVELPEKPVSSPQSTVDDHFRYQPDLLTGQIECTFETKSPLYTRSLMSPDFFALNSDKAFHELTQAQREERAQFYQQHSKPVVPGSSLRGMVRQLVEIISFGKFLDVTGKSLFFRTLDTSTIGKDYGKRMSGGDRKGKGYFPLAKAGYIKKTKGDYKLIPAVDNSVFRVEESTAKAIIRDLKHMARQNNQGNYGPDNAYKWLRKQIWFKPVAPTTHKSSSGDNLWFALVDQISIEKPLSPEGWEQGWFIASGWVPSKHQGKHRHWIISAPGKDEMDIADQDIELYSEEGAGITQKITKENFSVLPRNLDELVPCFYHEWKDTEGNQRLAFGHTAMFRLPYEHTPADLVPEALRDKTQLDIAEHLFGFVRDSKTVAGRVFFSDALLANEQTDVWYREELVVPQILSGPKPTSFQLYLTQDNPAQKDELNHFDSPKKNTTLRGYKLYWHRGENPNFQEAKGRVDIEKWKMQKEQGSWVKDTQHTLIKPVKSGVKFTFAIRFENIHAVELGALLWVLQPPALQKNQSICHKLGMGKPLGLGSIQICDVQVKVDDRVQRYQSLFDEQGWAEPTQGNEDYRQRFEEFMKKQVGINADFKNHPRIQQLLTLMMWEVLSETEISYQQLKEFKERPVLPNPLDVGKPVREQKPVEKLVARDDDSGIQIERYQPPLEPLPEVREQPSRAAMDLFRQFQTRSAETEAEEVRKREKRDERKKKKK